MSERPVLVAILTAGAVVAAAGLGAWLNGRSAIDAQAGQSKAQLALQHEQFRGQLILKALDMPSQNDRIRNLQFLINAGLLDDPGGRIMKLVAKDPSAVPFIPSRGGGAVQLGDCVRPRSEEEWRSFQRRNRLPETGLPDAATQKAVVAMETRCKTPYAPGLDFSDPRNSQYLPSL